ncbi:MAG: hypothetical protein ACI9DJ_003222 [Algoriphagus sp.]|jgi:hypothetical protein
MEVNVSICALVEIRKLTEIGFVKIYKRSGVLGSIGNTPNSDTLSMSD